MRPRHNCIDKISTAGYNHSYKTNICASSAPFYRGAFVFVGRALYGVFYVENSNRLVVGNFAGRGGKAWHRGAAAYYNLRQRTISRRHRYKQFYNKLVSSSEFPHTAQLGYDELMGVFGDAKAKGDEVLVIPIASALSGSFEWAERAAAESGYDKIKVYDSKCTTFMLEILVREAVRLKERPVEEVVAALDELRPRIKLLAALDTLEYLKRGGRINKTVATVGSMLKIKPVITVSGEGKMELIHKSIGMNAALRYISERFLADKRDENYAVRTIYCMEQSNCEKLRSLAGSDGAPEGYRYQTVTTGITDGDWIEIIDGLSEGDTIAYLPATNDSSGFMGMMMGGMGGGGEMVVAPAGAMPMGG